MSILAETPKVRKQKSSVLNPRYRAYSDRKWRETNHTHMVLEQVRAELQAAGKMSAVGIVSDLMCDVQKGQRRMLGTDF